MTKDRNRKEKIRTAAEAAGTKYTIALRDRESKPKAAKGRPAPWPRFEPGMRIRFANERQAYTVQAVSASGRYVVCTRPFNLQRTVFYTVMDLAKGIRGADNRVFSPGYETIEDCQDVASAFEATDIYTRFRMAGRAPDRNDEHWLTQHPELVGKDGIAYPCDTEVSYRNWVWIRLADNQPDARVARWVPALRTLVAGAPSRAMNDQEPRTAAEWRSWSTGGGRSRYYATFRRADNRFHIGARLPRRDLTGTPQLCATPRGINLQAIGGPELWQWITQQDQYSLFAVKPAVGDEVMEMLPKGEVADAWLIEEELPGGLLLGPHADDVHRAVRNLEGLFSGTGEPNRWTEPTWSHLRDRYATGAGDIEREHDVLQATAAACEALAQNGDSNNWPNVVDREHGCEYVGIAARDLFGTVPGWTQQAYDLMMIRYRRTFGHDFG